MELLLMDTSFYGQLLEEGDCKLAIRYISDILSMLSCDNTKISDAILDAIKK